MFSNNFRFLLLFLLFRRSASELSLSIALITDTHIGENCTALTFELCKPMRNLRDAVSRLNNLHASATPRLDGVFVSGDLTSSALPEQYEMVRELLDDLDVPFFPLLGNHDSWPYAMDSNGTFTQDDAPNGDKHFVDIFRDIFFPLNRKSRPDVSTTFTIEHFAESAVPNGDFPGIETWHTNYVVTFAALSNIRFLCMDWVARGSAWPYAGVGPEAELHDYANGTIPFLQAQVEELIGLSGRDNERASAAVLSQDGDNKEEKWQQRKGWTESQPPPAPRAFLVQHHPFHNRNLLSPLGRNELDPFGLNSNFTFDMRQDERVQEVLAGCDAPNDSSNGKASCQPRLSADTYLGVAAGHMHRWRRNASAFTRFTGVPEFGFYDANGSLTGGGLREFETSASKGWEADEQYTSAVTLLHFKAASLHDSAELVSAEGMWLLPDGTTWETPPAYQ